MYNTTCIVYYFMLLYAKLKINLRHESCCSVLVLVYLIFRAFIVCFTNDFKGDLWSLCQSWPHKERQCCWYPVAWNHCCQWPFSHRNWFQHWRRQVRCQMSEIPFCSIFLWKHNYVHLKWEGCLKFHPKIPYRM